MASRLNYFFLTTKLSLCLFAGIATSSLHAQTTSKTDSSHVTAKSAMLASNLAPAKGDKKDGYKHVPLAGEKSYFGDKNDYMNDFVRKYLELHYNTLGSVQNRSSAPFSVIDNELERKNMPKELKY